VIERTEIAGAFGNWLRHLNSSKRLSLAPAMTLVVRDFKVGKLSAQHAYLSFETEFCL
jgi:hypothetical protein